MISTVSISNQSVTVNQTCTSSSVVLNRVYWFRRRQVSSEPRPHKKSTKILGFGIFMIGVVILAVSLIIGIEFPLYVSRKILKDQCILEKKHNLYDNWVRDSDYRRINRVYFWAIDNPDDFINGLSTPKFVERGPYVYTETRRKLNVVFSNHRISYQTWVSQTFNADLTRTECGQTCMETDKVNALNTELLQKLYHFGGWDNYTRALTRNLVKITMDKLLTNRVKEDVYKYVGCVTEICVNETVYQALSNDTFVQSLAFGKFVSMGDTKDKITLLSSTEFIMNNEYFKPKFMESLYSLISIKLSNPELSISTKQACNNVTLQETPGHILSVFIKNVSALAKEQQVLYNSTETNGTVYTSHYCDLSLALQTLLSHLQTFEVWTNTSWTLRVCRNGANIETCDETTESYNQVLAYLNVTLEFTDVYLLNIVSEKYKSNPGNQLVWSKSQKDLVRGYTRNPDDVDPYRTATVNGLLEHYTDFMDAYRNSPSLTVSTCLDGDTTDHNMVAREYNGMKISPVGVHRNSQQPISGYTTSIPPSNTCRACAQPSPNSEVYEVFFEDVQRSLTYRLKKETVMQGVSIYEFGVDDDDLRGTTSCGLINVTSIRNYPAVIGNPYYRQSNCEHLERHTRDYRTESMSYMKVEPLTGRFWEQSTRLQTSVLVLPEYLGGVTQSSFHEMTYTGQPLPLFWVDKRVDIEQSVIDTYESKINHLMRVSCGGLIGLTLVSIAIMCLSVFVGLLSQRKNKVQPFVEDTAHGQE